MSEIIKQKMTFDVQSEWISHTSSVSYCKIAKVESENHLELLHKNIKQYGTVFNTVSPGTVLNGKIIKKTL